MEVDLEAYVDRIRSRGSDLRSRRFTGIRGAADDRRPVLGLLRQRETRLGGRPVGEYGYVYHTEDGGRIWGHQAGEFGFSEETG